MDPLAFLQQHVHWAIALGSLLEGESSAVLAGVAAQQGLASYAAVFAIVTAVSAAWDNAMFTIGRWRGVRVVNRWPALGRRVARVLPWLHRYRWFAVFGVRFGYGLRTAGPIALGMSGMHPLEFLALSVPAALAWAGLYSGLGFAFGQAVTSLLSDLVQYQLGALAVVAGLVLAVAMARRSRRRRRGGADATTPDATTPDA